MTQEPHAGWCTGCLQSVPFVIAAEPGYTAMSHMRACKSALASAVMLQHRIKLLHMCMNMQCECDLLLPSAAGVTSCVK